MSEVEIIEPQNGKSLVVEQSVVAILNKSEIDQQIATAHAYPRSIKRFRDEAYAMVTLNEAIAQECIYSLPRDGKVIEGPSARFAEIIQSAWGNCRAGARVVSESADFITSQGVFHDLEKNSAITYEVQRRITDRNGRRYKPDMIGVTGNAACSIALRNAVLKGIPKAFWADLYEAARRTVMGDFATLANRRAAALNAFKAYGVKEEEIFALLNVRGIEDVAPEHLVTLRGTLTAIKEGETTVEEAFGRKPLTPPTPPTSSTVSSGSNEGGTINTPAASAPKVAKPKPRERTKPRGEGDGKSYVEHGQEAMDSRGPTGPSAGEGESGTESIGDPDEYLEDLKGKMSVAKNADTLAEVWTEHVAVQDQLLPPDREKADAILEFHRERLEKAAA
jgi:hypothetical protein